jgi:hypothetical protein
VPAARIEGLPGGELEFEFEHGLALSLTNILARELRILMP